MGPQDRRARNGGLPLAARRRVVTYRTSSLSETTTRRAEHDGAAGDAFG